MIQPKKKETLGTLTGPTSRFVIEKKMIEKFGGYVTTKNDI